MTYRIRSLLAATIAALAFGASWNLTPAVADTVDVRPPGAIAAGVRAAPGTVGFLGDPATLDVIDSQATANTYAPGATWYTLAGRGGQLIVHQDDLTLDGVWVKGTIDYYGSGTLTIRQSIIESSDLGWAVVLLRSSGADFFLSDSDIVWPADVAPPGSPWSNGCLHGDAHSTVIRNDISGCPDGVQQAGGNSQYRQNVIRDLRLIGTYPNNSHNDGLQLYGGDGYVVANNWIELNGYDQVHQNAAVFFSDDGATTNSPRVINNYLSGGGFQLRFEQTTNGAIVKRNDFGCICGGFGHVSFSGGADSAEWSNNKRPDGSLIPDPA